MESTYTGAPDECSIHFPTKLDANGNCPVEGCPPFNCSTCGRMLEWDGYVMVCPNYVLGTCNQKLGGNY